MAIQIGSKNTTLVVFDSFLDFDTNVPGSSSIFLIPDLESAFPPRSHRSFEREMVFRDLSSGTEMYSYSPPTGQKKNLSEENFQPECFQWKYFQNVINTSLPFKKAF